MMASRSEAGPSTSVTNCTVEFIATGNVTTGPVIVNSSSSVDEFPLPQRIKTFRGRAKQISELEEAFFTQQKTKVVICGLGGFGKTELAKQFAHQCFLKKKVQSVVWIASENANELKESFKKLKPIYNKYADEKLLIIFDNCVNQQSIAEYEPDGNKNHSILITSQYKQWKSDVTIIELQPLSSTSAIEIFKLVLGTKYRVTDEHLYETLARSVSYIPLGLQIVASYVEQEDEDLDLAEYVNDIEKSEENIINEIIPDCADNSYNKSINDAMITSLHKIKNKRDQKPQIRELAHDVLCFCAYLHPDRLQTNDLLVIINMLNNKYRDNELKSALKLIINFSFLRYGDDDKSYVVQHRITQSFLRYYINESSLQYKYYKVYLYLVLDEHQYNIHNISSILNYADSNIEIVHDFYKDNNMHENIGLFLRKLISHECIVCIKTIFENSVEQTKKHMNNLLAYCARRRNINVLKVLLPHFDINSKDKNQNTALHVFANWQDLEGIKLLIENGGDVNVLNAEDYTPLFIFIRESISKSHDWDDVFKTFKSDLSVTNIYNETLLHAAVDFEKIELVDFLIKNGTEVNATDLDDFTPLDVLYGNISASFYFDDYLIDDYLGILKKLLAVGAKSNFCHKRSEGDTCDFLLLNYTLKRNNFDLLLLKSGVDVNSRNRDQQTVLHKCGIKINLKATQILIKHNADCYVKDRHGDTPLFCFVKYGVDNNSDMDLILDMLDLLKCHPEHTDSSGNTVLHIAARNYKVKLVEILLMTYKFDVNQQNLAKNTPLHVLMSSVTNPSDYQKKNIVRIIDTFIVFDARLDLKNNLNKTPSQMLLRKCSEKEVEEEDDEDKEAEKDNKENKEGEKDDKENKEEEKDDKENKEEEKDDKENKEEEKDDKENKEESEEDVSKEKEDDDDDDEEEEEEEEEDDDDDEEEEEEDDVDDDKEVDYHFITYLCTYLRQDNINN